MFALTILHKDDGESDLLDADDGFGGVADFVTSVLAFGDTTPPGGATNASTAVASSATAISAASDTIYFGTDLEPGQIEHFELDRDTISLRPVAPANTATAAVTGIATSASAGPAVIHPGSSPDPQAGDVGTGDDAFDFEDPEDDDDDDDDDDNFGDFGPPPLTLDDPEPPHVDPDPFGAADIGDLNRFDEDGDAIL